MTLIKPAWKRGAHWGHRFASKYHSAYNFKILHSIWKNLNFILDFKKTFEYCVPQKFQIAFRLSTTIISYTALSSICSASSMTAAMRNRIDDNIRDLLPRDQERIARTRIIQNSPLWTRTCSWLIVTRGESNKAAPLELECTMRPRWSYLGNCFRNKL